MGLDCSHHAFHGSYGAFNRLRSAVAKAMGGSFPPHEAETSEDGTVLEPGKWYWGKDFGLETHPGLYIFLSHSDCDGNILPEECAVVARDLELLLPTIDQMGLGSGHIEAQGGYGSMLRKFISGCRASAAAGEVLEFF